MEHHQIFHTRDMIEKCLPIMTNYRIYLLRNESNPYTPFYTADHPIMMDNVYYKKMKKYDSLIANGMGYYQHVIYVNSRLVGYCNRFVYCIDNEFDIAYRMLKDFPKCRSEMRKRGEMKQGLPPELI